MSSISKKAFLFEVDCDFKSEKRVIFHPNALKSAKLCTGDVISVSSGLEHEKFAVGVAWPSLEVEQDSVRVSSSFLLTAGVSAGSNARISSLSGTLQFRNAKEAVSVKLIELGDKISSKLSEKNKGKGTDWLTLFLREILVDIKYITASQILEVTYEGELRRFKVSSVSRAGVGSDELTEDMATLSLSRQSKIWIATWDTAIAIDEEDIMQEKSPSINIPQSDGYAAVGGLAKQISEIRDLLEIPLTRPELFRHFGLKPPRGILLHGPPGTGKTHLARAIAASTNSSVLVVNGPELSSAYHGETESKLREVFREAQEKTPCIIVLDEIDALVPRREDSAGGEVEKRVVATLLTLLDGMESSTEDGAYKDVNVIVIGTTNRPNAIDPALRRPGRFDREIEIGIPDADARLSILQVLLSHTPHSLTTDDLRALSSRAHGYVGADLNAVVREAGTISIKRHLSNNKEPLTLTLSDLLTSLPTVRPSAMRSLFVEHPPISYADIGGQGEVIKKLKEAVEWPLLFPDAFRRLGVKPPKGVLLYGPPGCSKTVLARACACESGVNFVAVKGPELLNKYVGESERGVREIFRKARAAAPSIIFFDEIDALATSRTSSEGDTGSSHEGVLTSLLNEMDGVQELLGVTVIAATNRPSALDSALMRPGRLDRLLFVGPPDQAGREEILKIRTRNMKVDPNLDIPHIASLAEGCSGAEISALCQEAALLTMQGNIDAPYVPHESFVAAARSIPRQITPAILQGFIRWRSSQ